MVAMKKVYDLVTDQDATSWIQFVGEILETRNCAGVFRQQDVISIPPVCGWR